MRMQPNRPTPRGMARRGSATGAGDIRRRRDLLRFGVETLEDRRLLAGLPIAVGGLQFVPSSDFSVSGSTYSLTGSVQVGFDPGVGAFKPVLSLSGGIVVRADAEPSFHVDGTITESLTGGSIPLYDGSETFDIHSLINTGLSGLDGEGFDAAGVAFQFDEIRLVNGPGSVPEIQLQGSLAVAGLTVSVDGSNHVAIGSTGISLTGVDATLTGSTTIGALTFDANDLSVAYGSVGGNDVFTITGATSFTVEGSTVQVDWGGTTPHGTATAGLIVENGDLRSLDMAVTASVTIAALTFTADDLVVAYTESTSTFAMTGTAGFKLVQSDAGGTASNDLSAHFGGTAAGVSTAGLVIVDGDLTRLDMTVTSSFTLFGLTLATNGLVVEYQDAPTSRFVMYGAIAISSSPQPFASGPGRVFDGVTATLGNFGAPGLLVQGGFVQDVNVTVNGSFDLFGLDVAPDGLTVAYTRSKSTVQITGDLTVSLAGSVSASADFDDGGILIDAKTGAVQVDGLTLDLEDVSLGVATIQQFELSYTQTQAATTFDASLVLTFAGGWSVGASMDFLDGQVQTIGVDYSAGTGEGIELGPSGLFLTEFSVTIDDIASGVTTVSGTLAVEYGPQVTINGRSVAIITATGAFLIDEDGLSLTNVDVDVADGIIGSGTGSLTADWSKGDYSMDASLSLLDGVFQVEGSFQMNSAGDFLLLANAYVEIPEAVPVIGGSTIASMDFALKYLPDDGSPTGFIAAWTTISFLGYDQSLGFEYAIDGSISSGSFSLLGDDGVEDVEDQLNLPPVGTSPPMPVVGYILNGDIFEDPVVGPTLTVPAGTSTVSLLLTAPGGGFQGDVYILVPPDTSVPGQIQWLVSLNPLLTPLNTPQIYLPPGGGKAMTFSIRQNTGSTIAVLIQAAYGEGLPTGEYAVVYADRWDVSQVTATNSFTYIQPAVSAPYVQVQSTPDSALIAVWGPLAFSLARSTTVSFYATTSPTGAGGVFIGESSIAAEGIAFGPGNVFHAYNTWDASGFTPGTYYFYAVVRDGQNPPVVSPVSSLSFVVQPAATGVVTAAGRPIAGATVQIFFDADPDALPDAPDHVLTTGRDGRYALPSGGSSRNFVVKLVVPAGYRADGPTAYAADYAAGDPARVDFVLTPRAAIAGSVAATGSDSPIPGATVFLDYNRNGILDPGEPSGLSDTRGRYSFLNMEPGAYRVVIQTPGGYAAAAATAVDVTVADAGHRVSGVDFRLRGLDVAPASSLPVFPAAGATFGPLMTTSISGTAADPRGPGAIRGVLVSFQDLATGLYWNGVAFAASPTPIYLTAQGGRMWRLPIDVEALISGHTYRVGSLALDAQGYDQAAPSYRSFTYQGPAVAPAVRPVSMAVVDSNLPVSVPGQSVQFEVTVAGIVTGAGTPSGTVWLYDGPTRLASASLKNGRATFRIDSLTRGVHAMRVHYSGDGIFLPGDSEEFAQVVRQVALQSPDSAAIPAPPWESRPGPGSNTSIATEAATDPRQILAIGGAEADVAEQIVLRPYGMGRFVQVRIVQISSGEVLYQGRILARSLRGIVVYDGPGEESIAVIGRLPVGVWTSRAGVLSRVWPKPDAGPRRWPARLGATSPAAWSRASARPEQPPQTLAPSARSNAATLAALPRAITRRPPL